MPAFSTILQDFRYALRQLRHSPGFAITAIITLALGIGANVVVFSVLNSMLLQPMHYANPKQVVFLQSTTNSYGVSAYPDYKDLRDRNTTFSSLATYRMEQAGISTTGGAQSSWGLMVSGNYFDMLGVQPYLGRMLQPSDDTHPGASAYIVLSYDGWQSLFGGDKSIVGKIIHLDKVPFLVVGVASKSFTGTERWYDPQYWVPIQNASQLDGFNWLNDRNNQNLWIIGRLKPGVTSAMAAGNIQSISRELAKTYPKDDANLGYKLTQPGLMGDTLGGPVKAFLWGVMLLAGLVLLAACANLGSLFGARASDRSRELAIRVAVGAGRGRIFRQLLTESTAVAVLGGAAGLAIAFGLLHLLSQWNPASDFGGTIVVHTDAWVFVFAASISVLTGMLFGLVPARQVWRTDPSQAMKSGSNVQPGRSRWPMRDVLLAVQIAICCLLVTASLVAMRGLQRTLHANLGFNPHEVTLATVNMSLDGYTGDSALPVQRQLVDRISQLPGVTSVAFANSTPLSVNQSFTGIFSPEVVDFNPRNESFRSAYYDASPGYFRAADTAMLAGRGFSWQDNAKFPPVAVVNETFARKLFGTPNAVGRYFKRYSNQKIEIVGVVEDGKYTTVSEKPRAAVWFPVSQQTNSDTELVVRSQHNDPGMAAEVRDAIRRVDPNLPISYLGSWKQELTTVLLPSYAATTALGVFGALAILLSLTGIFGLASYTVSRRVRELGIRVALGASHRRVVGAALRRPMCLLCIGSIAGLIGGIAASRLLASVVYQATPDDPLVLIGVVITMLVVGAVATWVPARRAIAIDPIKVLREQ